MPAQPLAGIQKRIRRALLAKIEAGDYRLEDVPECLCGSNDGQALAFRDRHDIPVGTLLCLTCGLVRASPRLAAQHLPSFYEHEYHGLHEGTPAPDPDTALFRTGRGAAIASLVSELLPSGSLRIADVGAGTGQVLRELAQAIGRDVVGVGCEYASAYVDVGKGAGSDIRQGGPAVLIDAAPFDLVILSHVVEHFPDPVADLQPVRQLGTDTTLFYVEVPGLLTIDQKPECAYRLSQYLTLAHTFYFTRHTLEQTMQRAGFSLVRGDEEVRSIFRRGPAALPTTDPREAERIRDSLRKLDSWSMRIRRAQPLVRQRAAAAVKTVLPGYAVRAIRRRLAWWRDPLR